MAFGFFNANAQVGIGNVAPASTLDITATNPTGATTNVDGILIPRVDRQRAGAMTAIPNGTMIFVNSIATGTATLINTNITATGFYFFDTSALPAPGKWIASGSDKNWSTVGNTGTTATNNFIGTTDVNPLVFRTTNIERMRIIPTTGEVAVGSSIPFTGDKFSSYAVGAEYAVNGYSTLGGYGVYGENNGTGSGVWGSGTATTGANNGVRARAASNTGFGLNATNVNTTGTGAIIVGNNAAGTYLTTGSGAAINGSTVGTLSFGKTAASGIGAVSVGNNLTGSILVPASGAGAVGVGTQYGVMGFATTTVNTNPNNNNGSNAASASAGGYFEVQSAGTAQSWSYVGVRDNTGVNRKIIGNGTVNTIVNDLNGKLVALSCPEAPENLFQDYGQGNLINGKSHIEIDPIFAKNIAVNEKHPLRVFVQLEGDCEGVFISNKTQNGFDVTELKKGKSNVKFTYSIIANRADEVNQDGTLAKYSEERFAPAPGPQIKTKMNLSEINPKDEKDLQVKLQKKIDVKGL